MKRLDEFYRFLASKRLAVILFLLICLSLVPGTLAESDFHVSGASRVLFGVLGLNLLLCTAQRLRTLARPVLVLHLGTLIIIAGMVASSFGYVATVNIYEGSAVDTAYRWDREEDAPLGLQLGVREIHRDYYPVAIKVGVLRGGEKIGLFELRTGQDISLGPYSIRADSLDVPSETLKLSIHQGDRLIGATDTSDTAALLPDFPYTFKLVGYKDPVVSRAWVDLELADSNGVIASGTSEVNGPFHWNGLSYYCTLIDSDDYGNGYAGIQIVRDPGRPVVFSGFAVVMAGCLFWVYRKFSIKNPAARFVRAPRRAEEAEQS